MKLKSSLILFLSLASTAALAASQTNTNSVNNAGFLNQQFLNMNNGTGVLAAGTNWFNHIGISGLLNVDSWGQSNANFLKSPVVIPMYHLDEPSHSNIGVDTLRLNFDADVNSWVNAHISLFYADQDQPIGISAATGQFSSVDGEDIYYFGRPSTRYYAAGQTSGLDVDQAYVDVGNFAESPLMLRAGKQYVPFGNYSLDTITPTLTQQLSETRETAVQLAVATPSGFHASVYGFKGIPKQVSDDPSNSSDNIGNGGAALGYTNLAGAIGFDLGAQYLYNMADVGDIAQYLLNGYTRHVSAWAGNATMMAGPYSLGIKYVSAIGKFAPYDFTYYTDVSGTPSEGASPSAGTLQGSYVLSTYGYSSLLTASYQWSKQSYALGGTGNGTILALPANRWEAEYDINVLQNTMLGFEFHHDTAYNTDNFATGLSSNTGTVRLSVLL